MELDHNYHYLYTQSIEIGISLNQTEILLPHPVCFADII